MTYRFGVIGPAPSVQRILEITAEIDADVRFIPLIYNHPQEIPDILEQNRPGLKGWFFSGPIPMSIARPYIGEHELAVYCKAAGSALYKGIIQMMTAQDMNNQPYSIDMIRSEDLDLHESFAELGMSTEGLYLNIFDGPEDPYEIIDFHLKLWKSGKSAAALTCMHFIYKELQKHQMPVYRLMITSQDIRQAAQLLIQQARSLYFKDSQIGMQIIEANLQEQRIRTGDTGRYSVQYAELQLQQRILQLCERMDGMMIHSGTGSYQIISTRGAIEREVSSLHQALEQMELETDSLMSVGIGYGDTAFTAGNHAALALQHARQNRKRLLVIVQDNGDIRELDKKEGEWGYSLRLFHPEILEKLNQANVSVKTYRKIEALIRHMNWDGFTTVQLAQHMSMTIRNAQRIMSSLCQIGLAEIDGEEQQSVRGRPRKVYRLQPGRSNDSSAEARRDENDD